MQAIELNINKLILFIFVLLPYTNSLPPLIGVHPLDEKYYASKVIKCKDGSKTFTRNRVNDDFCDCVDGTDEPGTSACPRGKFYCRNIGSTPQFVFASRVNDQICDCCDGSDEYGNGVHCPNICVMGGNVEYKAGNYKTFVDAKESTKLSDQNLLQKATGLKMVIILQMVLLGCVVIFRKFYRRTRFKRRHHDHEV